MTVLTPKEREYLRNHPEEDPHRLLLKKLASTEIRWKVVAAQLAARQKARTKLPGWTAHPEVLFPPALSVEQSSSEGTAAYKGNLVERSAEKGILLDLTGGMGVDSLAFSRYAGEVHYIEIQAELVELAAHNLPLLGGTNIRFHQGNGIEFLRNFGRRVDWVFLDPARRDGQGGKVFRLEDCEPGLNEYRSILSYTRNVMLKTSPLIDLEAALSRLPGVREVHVVSVDNECKEVLFILKESENQAIPISTVNLRGHAPTQVFIFSRTEETRSEIKFSLPGRYLFEPNASVMKAGGFRSVAARFGLGKLATNSHLYTSDELIPDFPGRSFELLQVCRPDRKEIQQVLSELNHGPVKANLAVRNFPEPVKVLKKKLGIADGGDLYLFATTLFDANKRILVTRKATN
ncbi:THUMP-like domain-containing protein [Larkinella soli]|uniref:THUMP-like domain-containing protein n=1 Tax=Larkinella soli TaxID=1770527 RepID=UPI000FFBA5B0|nr:RsmD family RNA methyltransferase [Larkinella soli]